jgi:cytochrome c1
MRILYRTMPRYSTALVTPAAANPRTGCVREEHSAAPKRGRDRMEYYHAVPAIPSRAFLALMQQLVRTRSNGNADIFRRIAAEFGTDLARWIQHPQAVHPGTAMRELGVTPQDAEEIAQYLEELL